MGRSEAKDHHLRREAILKEAARAFADAGFAATSMATIARACGVSKALLYHYYPSKERILDDILTTHLERLVEVTEAVDGRDAGPAARLEALSVALLEAYRHADAEHRIQLGDLQHLPPERQEALRGLERRLVAVFAEAIAAAHPHLAGRRDLLKPLTMSLFGMLNWQYLWFREDGPMDRAGYARLATRLVLRGAPAADEVAAPPADRHGRGEQGARRAKGDTTGKLGAGLG